MAMFEVWKIAGKCGLAFMALGIILLCSACVTVRKGSHRHHHRHRHYRVTVVAEPASLMPSGDGCTAGEGYLVAEFAPYESLE